jgi:DNA-binding SARP family transcriptional activator
MAYVLSDEVRRHWDAVPIGPTHRPALDCARLLLAARSGAAPAGTPLPAATVVLTSLPLPWSVELAARSHASGSADGAALLARLSTWAPGATHEDLTWLAGHGDAEARRGAVGLLAAAPAPSTTSVRVEVLGPLRVSIGGVPVQAPELRRGRVRALLALLVACGPVRRERVMDVMWPELDPPAASRNLRVTLTRLRQLLEPGRRPGAPGARLEVDGDLLWLDDERVEVDLWELRRHVQAAEAAQRAGNSAAAAGHLQAAHALWRGDPLADLDSLAAVAPEREQARRAVVDAALRLGELQLVAGQFDESAALAEQVKATSPYDERAHRLAIAAHLQRQDRVATAAAVRDTEVMLAELGVEAAAPTQMLLRQAAARLGSLATAPVAPPIGIHPGGAVDVAAPTKPLA